MLGKLGQSHTEDFLVPGEIYVAFGIGAPGREGPDIPVKNMIP